MISNQQFKSRAEKMLANNHNYLTARSTVRKRTENDKQTNTLRDELIWNMTPTNMIEVYNVF